MSTSRLHSRSLPLAAAISMALCAAQAVAQESSIEEIIVTGTLIRGTPEDQAMPVEVITEEELRDLGRPSNLDLVKTLSEVGQVAGETDRYNAFPVGAATVNLRNLGSRYTTVVFNGRRFPEQFSPVTGRFNNVAWIPNAALGRVEVLKGGGAVTYGADAVAGVVNYITRTNFDGLEVNADYRYIEDSDGDYTADALWGKTFERGNALVAVGYQHRSNLFARDRDWALRHYLENDEGWSTSGSPGSYAFSRALAPGGAQVPFTPTQLPASNQHMSAGGIVRDPNCEALGGVAGWSGTPSPVCRFQQAQFEKLVEQSDSFQFYSELNYDLTDSLRFHSEATYYTLKLDDIAMHPSDGPLAWPLLSDTSAGRQTFLGTPAYFVPGANPAVRNFLENFTNSNGATAFSTAQINSIVNSGQGAMVFGTWRPFGNGGNPLSGEYDVQENTTQMWRVTGALGADLPQFWGASLEWEVGVTYSYVKDEREARDVLVDRLQAALNGLGGPNCTGNVPGQNGCEWLNPFSSAIPSNIYTGAVNPGFQPGLVNSPELVSWMYTPIWLERTYELLVVDPIIRGETGIELPGGPIAIAFGGQYRRGTEDTRLDDLSNRAINPCATPGVTDCPENIRTGPLAYLRPTTVLGATLESDREFPVRAGFLEAKLPLLDALSLNVAARYEKFYSDVTDQDNSVFAPAASVLWRPLQWLGLRASAGETFSQVNPPENDGPTVGNSLANNTFGGFGGAGTQYVTANYDNVGVDPERGVYFDVGFLVSAGGFSASVDFFDIKIKDYARTLTAAQVIAALVEPGQAPAANNIINCASPLFGAQPGLDGRAFVELAGACVPGQTMLTAPDGSGNISRINFFGGLREVNSGELHTNGIDATMSYVFDNVFGGALRPSIDLSYILTWELDDFAVFGVPVAEGYDGVGFRNNSTGRLGQAVPEWRGSFGLNWRRNGHTLNLLARYVPSVTEDDAPLFAPTNANNANIGDANGFTTVGGACTGSASASNLGAIPPGAGSGDFGSGTDLPANPVTGAPNTTRGFCSQQNVSILSGTQVDGNLNVDLTYRVELPAETALSLSIYNLLDEEPSFARENISFDSGFGSPLQRNYKLTLTKRF
jgi:iron complex outermembrane recepter protein